MKERWKRGGEIKGDGIIEEYETEGEENVIICCYRRGYYREKKENKNRYDNIMGRVKVMITDIETLGWNEYIIPDKAIKLVKQVLSFGRPPCGVLNI